MNRKNVLKGKKHLIWELWGYEKVDIWETSLLLSPTTDILLILSEHVGADKKISLRFLQTGGWSIQDFTFQVSQQQDQNSTHYDHIFQIA